MSFKVVEPAPARLNRSELAVPGSQPQLFEKAAKSTADVVFLDLEDAVAPDDKPQARKNVIAAASKRNESLHFGVADYAASTKARTTNIGGVNPNYSVLTDKDEAGKRDIHWGDMWHYAIARMVVAARANGLRPIDGPFGDFSDPDGYRAGGNRAGVLGCEGKWAIHPSQVALANEIFTPSDAEVKKAHRILEAMAQAQKEGKGAVSLDG